MTQTHRSEHSLDLVISAYLQKVGDGASCDPEEFIAAWPHLRDDFLRYVNQLSNRDFVPENTDSVADLVGGNDDNQTFVGRYRLGARIARGGMSNVYQATDE